MKRKKILLIAAIVFAICIAVISGCNKDNLQSKETECKTCSKNYYDVSSVQQVAASTYLEGIDAFQAKESSVEFIGVTDLNNTSLDISVILARLSSNDSLLLYCLFYDNDTKIVINHGLANNTKNGGTQVQLSFELNGTTVASMIYNNSNGFVVDDYENDSILCYAQQGRVSECYRLAKTACQQDPVCSTECDFLGWTYCDLVFWLSCVFSKLDPQCVVVS